MADTAYEDRLARLTELSDEEITQLEQDIIAAFDAADQADDLTAMSATADALDQVRAEMDSRGLGDESSEDPAEETVETPIEEAAEPVAAAAVVEDETTEVVEVEATEDPEEEAADDDSEAADPDSNDSDGDAAEDTQEGQEEATVDIPADRAPVVTASAVKVTAGADIPGISAGSEFASMEDVSQAFVKRLDSLKRATGGDGDQHLVASIVASADEDRQLYPSDPEGNWAKLQKVVGRDALTAAGGWCAPLETKYDIFGLGSAARPVRDALAGFQASRGGIRYTEPPKLGDNAAAVGLWTAAVDADPQAAVKAHLEIACADELTATVDAVTLQLQFGNLMARAYPELVTRNNELALIEHARLGELTLLSKIGTASTAVTSSFQLGAARDFLLSVGRAAAAYRSRHRMERTDGLRVIAPAWVLDAMREDIALGLPGTELAAADGVIESYLSARNVNVSWHMDDSFPAQAPGALVDFPATIVWYIFAEGTFLFLDGGTLDLGIVRDSTLVSTNDYVMFVETFEGVAKIGIESVKVTTTTHVAGGVAGTVDTVA